MNDDVLWNAVILIIYFAILILFLRNAVNAAMMTALATILLAFVTIFYVRLLSKQLGKMEEGHVFDVFFRLMDHFEKVKNQRDEKFQRLRDTDSARRMIRRKDGIIDFLRTRLDDRTSSKGLGRLESDLLENELALWGILNELCGYALQDRGIAAILQAGYSDMILYYHKNLRELPELLKKARESMAEKKDFSAPRSEHIENVVKKYYSSQ